MQVLLKMCVHVYRSGEPREVHVGKVLKQFLGQCVQRKRTRGQVEWHEHSQGVQPEPLYTLHLAGSPNLAKHPNQQRKEECEGTMANVYDC